MAPLELFPSPLKVVKQEAFIWQQRLGHLTLEILVLTLAPETSSSGYGLRVGDGVYWTIGDGVGVMPGVAVG